MDTWFFKSLMDYFDSDHDGTLDKDEWKAMFTTLSAAMPPEEVLAAEREWTSLFDTIDESEDGRLGN
jgi:Ca2+-binding EF-hand superfamily protein